MLPGEGGPLDELRAAGVTALEAVGGPVLGPQGVGVPMMVVVGTSAAATATAATAASTTAAATATATTTASAATTTAATVPAVVVIVVIVVTGARWVGRPVRRGRRGGQTAGPGNRRSRAYEHRPTSHDHREKDGHRVFSSHFKTPRQR